MHETTLLLANMGGPSAPAEVEPYLRAIFSDPAILPVPDVLRGPLGRWIARRRSPKVIERYRSIGGGSPLPEWTERQAARVREALGAKGRELRVTHAFRYTAPTVEQALTAEAQQGIRRIVLLPLFPHHTDAMTGSIERATRRAADAAGLALEVISAWGARSDVLELWSRMLAQALTEAGAAARVLFVAHGVPLRSVRRGEDHPERVADTAHALGSRLPSGTAWSLAYQSRVGPIRWTGPYLDDELRRRAESAEPLVLMPLSFVADCLETLYDLDQVATEQARRAGIRNVVRVAAFNDDPAFGRILAHMAIEQLDTGAVSAGQLAAGTSPAHHGDSGGNR